MEISGVQRTDDYYEYENYEIEIKYFCNHSAMNSWIAMSSSKR